MRFVDSITRKSIIKELPVVPLSTQFTTKTTEFLRLFSAIFEDENDGFMHQIKKKH